MSAWLVTTSSGMPAAVAATRALRARRSGRAGGYSLEEPTIVCAMAPLTPS